MKELGYEALPAPSSLPGILLVYIGKGTEIGQASGIHTTN